MPMLLVQAAEWEKMVSLPEGIGDFVSGTVGNDLVLLGGITWKDGVKHWRSSILRFDAREDAWDSSGSLPEAVAYAAFGQDREGIYFAGGSDGKNVNGSLQRLDSKLQIHTIARLPQPLVYSGHALGHGKLFVICGGTDVTNFATLTNLSYSLDLKTGKTAALPPYPAGNLLIPSAAVVGWNLYAFGGATSDAAGKNATNTAAAFSYSMDKNQWKAIKPYPLAIRGLGACALDERYILLGGGYTEAFTNFAAIYDTKLDMYLKTQPLPVSGSAHFVKAGEFVYRVGGENASRQRSDAVHRIHWKTLLRDAEAQRP